VEPSAQGSLSGVERVSQQTTSRQGSYLAVPPHTSLREADAPAVEVINTANIWSVSGITQLDAQEPSRTCDESKEEEEASVAQEEGATPQKHQHQKDASVKK